MIIIIPRELSLVFAGGARSVVVVKFDMLRVVVMNVKFVTHHLPPKDAALLHYYQTLAYVVPCQCQRRVANIITLTIIVNHGKKHQIIYVLVGVLIEL